MGVRAPDLAIGAASRQPVIDESSKPRTTSATIPPVIVAITVLDPGRSRWISPTTASHHAPASSPVARTQSQESKVDPNMSLTDDHPLGPSMCLSQDEAPRGHRRDIAANKTRIREAVTAAHTSVTDVFGVGPIVAAFLIGYTGDATRFASSDHYAAYNGTAPIEVSSGGKTRHRLSRRGNRKLNHAIHMAAVTQIRFETPGRAYYDKKQAEGKTKKEALRALKRRISNGVYQRLLADQQTKTS